MKPGFEMQMDTMTITQKGNCERTKKAFARKTLSFGSMSKQAKKFAAQREQLGETLLGEGREANFECKRQQESNLGMTTSTDEKVKDDGAFKKQPADKREKAKRQDDAIATKFNECQQRLSPITFKFIRLLLIT
uniref:4F5 domain-containing protein n=1 Tax=Ascaris lumbricoides TaxID=6252 RepID=A0A0M3I270_ASCLU